MNRSILRVLILLSIVTIGASMIHAQAVGDKFKADGLYYKVISLSPNEVAVTTQNEGDPSWDESERPQGALLIPASVSYEGIIFKVTQITDKAFSHCGDLTSVSISNPVTTIGYGAFQDCKALTSVTLPNGLKEIPEGLFRYCSSLTSVNIPNSVTTIGKVAFDACTSLTSIIIPNSVTTIEKYAFSVCFSLTSISIPASVTSIETGAFEGCSGLEFINVDPMNSEYISVEGVLFDQKQTRLICYPANSKRKSYTIPSSVKKTEESIFLNAIYLESVTIPNSITEIEHCSFQGCYQLKSISIPNSVKRIGIYSFLDCKSLTSVSIPNSITEIEDYAFAHCFSLTSINTQIESPNDVKIGVEIFKSVPKSCTLQVPMGTKALYQATDTWSNFANIEEVDRIPMLTVPSITVPIPAEGGDAEVQVNSNVNWHATSAESWLKLSKAEGSGNTTLLIQIEANNGTSPRSTTITFTAGELKEIVTVTQAGVTAIPRLRAREAEIWSAERTLYIRSEDRDTTMAASVFTIQGTQVARLSLQNGLNSLPLAQGVYLVQIHDETYKVIVS